MPDRPTFLHSLFLAFCLGSLLWAAGPGCASMPDPQFKKFSFPKNAFVGDVQRPYVVLGPVRSKVDYQTLDFSRDEKELCRNYYNRAVRDLLKYARKQGADAVVDVKSVVFLVDGRTETYATPECSDDGGEGQILTQGVAVKWKGAPVEAGAWTQPAKPRVPAAAAVVAAPPAVAAEPILPPVSAQNPNAPVFPVGGTLVPELDEPVVEPVAAKSAAAQEAAPAPVTVKMESYDAKGRGPAPASDTPPVQPVYPVFQAAPSAPPATPRLPFADPRAVPGSFQPAFP